MSETPPPAYWHIAFSADRNFSIPLALASLSLIRAAESASRYHLHILGIDVDASVTAQIRELCVAGGHRCSYHDVGQALQDVSTTDYFPSAAFARFLLPELLPDEVERVIYSDSDVMICRDLAELYDLDMGAHLLGAVQELAPVWNQQFSENYSRWARYFDLPEDASIYCYSGFILFNLPACREARLTQRVLEQAKRAGNQLAYPDQDIMNGLCQGQIMTLPQRYCVIPHLYAYYTDRATEVVAHPRMLSDSAELREAADSPSIIHFASSSKPFVLFAPRCGYEGFYSLWLSSPWKHHIPYLPHRMHHGIRVTNSMAMKFIMINMIAATYIPFYYPLWWRLVACLPESALQRVARFFNWNSPSR